MHLFTFADAFQKQLINEMEKMPKLSLFALFVLLLTVGQLSAQNCTDYLIYRNPVPPYKLDSQTKSATCQAGKTYKLVLTLSKGKDYRISFYASAIFDNKIQFKIIDKSSGKVIVDLPGESDNNEKGTAVLRPYLLADRMIHPFFEFRPENTTKLEIIIDVKTEQSPDEELKRGCVGVFVLNKIVENYGFQNQ